MVENPTPGLSMVRGDVPVTVTREERHQQALSRYSVAPGGERRIAAELAWCVIGSGKYKGERGVEVRVDGHRVGELTHMMSQRYAPLLASGERVGCEATVTRNERGLQVTLHLPRNVNTAVFAAEPPTERFAPVRPAPAAAATAAVAAAKPIGFGWQKPIGIVAVVVAFFVLLGVIVGGGEDEPSTTNTAADDTTTTTTTFEPPPTTTTSTTTTTTTTTPPPPPPTTTEVVAPPVTEEPVVEEPPPPAPEPEPEPECDPNYSGCVPIASDVDCEGGSGNGPAYASGPIRVVGDDIYKLDNDDDGVACE